MAEIGLTQAIAALRQELEEAMTVAQDEEILFDAISVEMQFQVGVTRSGEGKAGLKFWVIELGGSTSYATESVQSVSLSLRPALRDGRPVKISRGTNVNPLTGKKRD
ncbi:trypco2 family protein [Modestobacter altitudinis]|uniref:trypco2 family protein n=1 Tax=Modestobacter altitudinis TaxID=2213158 RepID=UPI0034E0896A